jgi:cellobiose-specific phosphotransferase system component IIA
LTREGIEDYAVGTKGVETAGEARSWMYWAMTAAAPRRTREADEMLGESVICLPR